jgi:hypothetical protein
VKSRPGDPEITVESKTRVRVVVDPTEEPGTGLVLEEGLTIAGVGRPLVPVIEAEADLRRRQPVGDPTRGVPAAVSLNPAAARKVVVLPRVMANRRVAGTTRRARAEDATAKPPNGSKALRLSQGLVPSGIIQPPFHQFEAPETGLHGPVDCILFADILVEHEVGDEGSTDTVAAPAVKEDGALAGLAKNREDAFEGSIIQRAGSNRNVHVFHAELQQ